MTRSSVTFIALIAASLLVAAGASNKEEPASPAARLDPALLKESLGSAAAIPLQQCENVASQPLLWAGASSSATRPLSTNVPLPDWLHLAAWYRRDVLCSQPSYTQHDDAVPMTHLHRAVRF